MRTRLPMHYRHRQQPISVPGLLKPLALRSVSEGFVGIFAALGEEVIVVERVVAEHAAGGGDVEYCYAGAESDCSRWVMVQIGL